MSKKFQRLVKSLKDSHTKNTVSIAIPVSHQKQFIKYLEGAPKIKPFFMKWLGKNPEARQAIVLIIQDSVLGFIKKD